jgi:chaperonin GroES
MKGREKNQDASGALKRAFLQRPVSAGAGFVWTWSGFWLSCRHRRKRESCAMQVKKQMIVVGDRVLLELDDGDDRTKSGLYLPASVREKEKVATGKVVRVGPGYPIPNPNYTEDEPWSTPKDPMRYIPLQAKEGDYAIFLREQAIEVEFEGKKFLIVPQSAVLMLARNRLAEDIE